MRLALHIHERMHTLFKICNLATFLGSIFPYLGNHFHKEQIADDYLQFIHHTEKAEYMAR